MSAVRNFWQNGSITVLSLDNMQLPKLRVYPIKHDKQYPFSLSCVKQRGFTKVHILSTFK